MIPIQKHVIINGVRIFFEERGQGEPLIFLHGLGSSHLDWEEQVGFFAKKFRVIAVDLRGHGRSERVGSEYSMSLFSHDLLKLMDELKITKANICGVSMGGMIAYQFAVDHPERLLKMVIVNSIADVEVKTLNEKFILYSRQFLLNLLGLNGMSKVLIHKLFPHGHQKLMRKKMLRRFADNTEEQYRASLNAIVGWGLGERIREIEAPTLVISSDHDYVPPSRKQVDVDKMPNARLEIIEDSGHLTPVDQPEKFNECVMKFLA